VCSSDLIGSHDDLTEFFEGFPDVSEVVHANSYYNIRLSKTEHALPLIVEGGTKRGLKISDIALQKPTLDQVFLQVTGSSMRDGAANGDVSAQKLVMERMK
jgi:ABC-2 type transport system ATP-binding protein